MAKIITRKQVRLAAWVAMMTFFVSCSSALADDIAGSVINVQPGNSTLIVPISPWASTAPTVQYGSSSDTITFYSVNDAVGAGVLTADENWSATDTLRLQMQNPTPYQQNLALLIKFNGSTSIYSASFSLLPTPTGTTPVIRDYIFHIIRTAKKSAADFGLKVGRPVLTAPYKDLWGSSVTIDTYKQTAQWKIKYLSTQNSAGAVVNGSQTVIFNGMTRFQQNYNMTGIIDEWGQFTDRDWTGKIRKTDDLSAQLTTDNADISAHPSVIDPAQPLALTKPANWTIQKAASGNWYFVSPVDGKDYWAFGMNAVNKGVFTTTTGMTPNATDRSSYFKVTPPYTNAKYQSAVGKDLNNNPVAYNYHLQNLLDIYKNTTTKQNGVSLNILDTDDWANHASLRLTSWGFNNVGTSSDVTMFTRQNFTWTAASLGAVSSKFKVATFTWSNLFPDPFASGFVSEVTNSINNDISLYNLLDPNDATKISPKMMGIYVDNELPWGSDNGGTWTVYFNIPLGVMASASTQPAKIAFADWMNTRYAGSISALNTAWGLDATTSYTGFGTGSSDCNANPKLMVCSTALPSSTVLESKTANTTADNIRKDLKEFLGYFANKYFTQVKAALGATKAKNVPYLGCRFNDWNQETVTKAALIANAVSFNRYRFALDMSYAPLGGTATDLWTFIKNLQSPVMFSEFGFTMQDEGGWGGGNSQTASSDDRAKAIREFLRAARKIPNIIGAQYYAYTDEPMSGRSSDGENKNFSFTSITDLPEANLVKEARTFASYLYTCREKGQNCDDPVTLDTIAPVASVDSPLAGTTLSGTFSVKVSATDNVGVASVNLYIDNVPKMSTSTSPYVFSIDSVALKLANGAHTLSATATDAAGNISQLAPAVSITVSNSTVDTTAPLVSVSSVSPTGTVSGVVTVKVRASDNVGVKQVNLMFGGVTYAVLTAVGSDGYYTFNFDVKNSSYGGKKLVNGTTYTVKAKALDAAGNWGYSTESFSIKVQY